MTQTLSREDVVGMSPGDARGSIFSGTYLVQGASIEACVCRAGDCSAFSALTGAIATVTQIDGVLTSQGDGTCAGGINPDGAFWCGEAEESGQSAIYGREQGTFLLVGGQPASKQFVVDTTVIATLGGVPHDCDLHAKGTATYVSP